jgi:hypothetical protein
MIPVAVQLFMQLHLRSELKLFVSCPLETPKTISVSMIVQYKITKALHLDDFASLVSNIDN